MIYVRYIDLSCHYIIVWLGESMNTPIWKNRYRPFWSFRLHFYIYYDNIDSSYKTSNKSQIPQSVTYISSLRSTNSQWSILYIQSTTKENTKLPAGDLNFHTRSDLSIEAVGLLDRVFLVSKTCHKWCGGDGLNEQLWCIVVSCHLS